MSRFYKVLSALAIAWPMSSSLALAYCSEPSAPYCASAYGPFNDEFDFDNCKRDMESYADEVDEFSACRAREANDLRETANEAIAVAQQASEEADSEECDARNDAENAVNSFNDAVQSFNRRSGQ